MATWFVGFECEVCTGTNLSGDRVGGRRIEPTKGGLEEKKQKHMHIALIATLAGGKMATNLVPSVQGGDGPSFLFAPPRELHVIA